MDRCRSHVAVIRRRLRLAAVCGVLALNSCAAESGKPAGASASLVEAPEPLAVASPAKNRATSTAAPSSTTWYVRTDGGDASQCTGRADAPYPGSGTAQACAWKHPFFALAPDGTRRIAGGDTLLIGAGQYLVGPGAAGAGNCAGADCHLPPIPSGPSADRRTRILGASCARPPQLHGSGGIRTVLNLERSSNVEVGCLEITDRSDCVYKHSHQPASCVAADAWARTGLSARASGNVWLHDLDIHGLAAQGIRAGGLRNWTVERVRLIANGRSGWDGNIGDSGSSNAGAIVLRAVEIAWNGCGERWRTRTPWACWAQKTGGYGDGLGTTYTGGQWLVEDAFIHHNTSDGLDLRYLDGAATTHAHVRRVRARDNAGNQIKIRGNATVEDSVIVGNCGFFSGRYLMVRGDQCRAGGNALQLVMTPGAAVTVRHNTIAGHGGVLIGTGEGDASARVRIENNVLVGFPTFKKPGVLAAAHYANDSRADVSWAGNLVWNVKGGKCPGRSLCGRHPKLADMALDSFDATPLADSPAVGNALRGDHRGASRAADQPADIGAIQRHTR